MVYYNLSITYIKPKKVLLPIREFVRDKTRRSSYGGQNRPDLSVFYQKSYPGSVGVTVGNLTTITIGK